MSKPKIAIFISCLLTGGTEVASLMTARCFKNLGYQVDIVVYCNEVDQLIQQNFEKEGIGLKLLGVKRGQGFFSLALGAKLIKLLVSERYQLIWVQYMTPSFIPLLIARFFTKNLISAIHVSSSHYGNKDLSRIQFLAQYWCNRFICVSNTVADGIFGSPKNRSEKIQVIANAIDFDEVQTTDGFDFRSKMGFTEQDIIYGFAGRLEVIKGVDCLIDALKLLIEDPQTLFNPKLIIVGGGSEADNLKNQVKALKLEGYVIFVGTVGRAEIYSIIKGFDVACMPSREGLEGFGLSALEAMALGVPVIASRVDALSEVVQDQNTGILFEVGNAKDLKTAMQLLGGNIELRNRMSKHGIGHALTLYSSSRYQEDIFKLITRLGIKK